MKIGATVIALGKFAYVVFFVAAALWLCLTAENE
jgi:hypothetical protein